MTACTHCGTDLPGGLKFCKQCGTPVAAIRTEAASAPCRNCHAALTPNQRFCNKCGTPVASVNDAGAIDAEVPASPAGSHCNPHTWPRNPLTNLHPAPSTRKIRKRTSAANRWRRTLQGTTSRTSRTTPIRYRVVRTHRCNRTTPRQRPRPSQRQIIGAMQLLRRKPHLPSRMRNPRLRAYRRIPRRHSPTAKQTESMRRPSLTTYRMPM